MKLYYNLKKVYGIIQKKNVMSFQIKVKGRNDRNQFIINLCLNMMGFFLLNVR